MWFRISSSFAAFACSYEILKQKNMRTISSSTLIILRHCNYIFDFISLIHLLVERWMKCRIKIADISVSFCVPFLWSHFIRRRFSSCAISKLHSAFMFVALVLLRQCHHHHVFMSLNLNDKKMYFICALQMCWMMHQTASTAISNTPSEINC